MNFYEIMYVIDDEQQQRLLALAERYKKVNGWNEKEMLQFAVTATSKSDIEAKIQFLENDIVKLEKKCRKQQKKPKQKRKYISDEEYKKCKRVVSAYNKELDDIEVFVAYAGKFGFVKLMYYRFPYGFEEAIAYTNSQKLFIDLWTEWFQAQLIKLTKNTPMAELDFKDMFKCLSKEKQKELMTKQKYFAKQAGMKLKHNK